MFIGILQIKFYLHGCFSLKEKRQRLRGLRDKFGTIKNMAVCEISQCDSWNHAVWSFVCVSNDKALIESSLSKVVEHCAHKVDAELTEHTIDWV